MNEAEKIELLDKTFEILDKVLNVINKVLKIVLSAKRLYDYFL